MGDNQAAAFKEYGPVETSVTWQPHPAPPTADNLGKNEVLIDNKAASINPVDWKIGEGHLKGAFDVTQGGTKSFVLGNDGSGIITAVGSDVKNFAVGDKVAYIRFVPSVDQQGSFAQVVKYPAEQVAKLGEMKFEIGASLGIVAITAEAAMDTLKIQKGDTILIQGGNGGVGSYAIQLAASRGATVYTTTRAENFEHIKSIAPTVIPIDYKTQDFAEVLKKKYPDGIDAILGTIHGYEEKEHGLLKKGGRYLSINAPPPKNDNLSVNAFTIVPASGEILGKLIGLINEGKLNAAPVATVPREKLVEALAQNKSGTTRGKVVVLF